MDALREAVVFLLAAYVEERGRRYADYIDHMADLEKGQLPTTKVIGLYLSSTTIHRGVLLASTLDTYRNTEFTA